MTDSSRRSWPAAVAWLAAGLIYLMSEGVAAASFPPSYSYVRNFISDLGVPSKSPLAWVMNTGFCVQGMLFLVGAVAIRTPWLTALTAVNTLGNLTIAFFHSGSATHAVGAVLAIVGGNAAILAGSSIIGGWHRVVSVGLGVLGLLGFALFAVELNTGIGHLGLVERCSVYPITAWQLLTATWLFSRRPTAWRRRARRA
jgi:hypothetical membrane protein